MLEERFWAKVDKNGPGGCWLWTAGKYGAGYGSFVMGSRKDGSRRQEGAHRLAWVFCNGPIPLNEEHHGVCVLHKCDNRSCVNPDHLFLGTIADNNIDMYKKGRGRALRGEKVKSSKLTAEDVIKIRSLAGIMTQRKIANTFNISFQHVSDIINRKRWAHL